MNIKKICLYRFEMKLLHPFQTHSGEVSEREGIIIEAEDLDGRKGYGECVAFSTPFYTAETVETAWTTLVNLLVPSITGKQVHHPKDLPARWHGIIGHQMAKAGLEAACWDLFAKQKEISLSACIGGTRDEVETGVVLSLADDIKERIEHYQQEGYRRYKLKVRKGFEYQDIAKVRGIAPELPVMIDGNGNYGEEDLLLLTKLDDLNLLMIEQPFASGDFYFHQQLQKKIATPICLDESIQSFHDAYQAIQLNSGTVINIKIGRVGGLTEALRIHDLCVENNIPVWCGGMLETGISRAHNIALASLPGFTIPGDISASNRYWEKDVITPEVTVTNGKITVPNGPGIGFNIDEDYLNFVTFKKETVHI